MSRRSMDKGGDSPEKERGHSASKPTLRSIDDLVPGLADAYRGVMQKLPKKPSRGTKAVVTEPTQLVVELSPIVDEQGIVQPSALVAFLSMPRPDPMSAYGPFSSVVMHELFEIVTAIRTRMWHQKIPERIGGATLAVLALLLSSESPLSVKALQARIACAKQDVGHACRGLPSCIAWVSSWKFTGDTKSGFSLIRKEV